MRNKYIAIYSRKSKFTGKGDSVENQVSICQNYIEHIIYTNQSTCNKEEILLFEDEGYSGGTTKRPQFQRLMSAIKNSEISVLIVYRLDRITRSISDFAQVLDTLKKYEVKFVSVSENFGDYSPMATAMMFMTSIFAQFEREIIAERIKDNMLELSKTGRWLGGTTPLGFTSTELTHIDIKGKERSSHRLTPIPTEIDIVQLIYNRFLEYKSLSGVETYLLKNNIQTRHFKSYSRFSLRNILTNPVYAVADANTFNYFSDLGCQIYNDLSMYDGKYAIMPYNRTLQQKGVSTKLRPYTEWIISVGRHQGIIASTEWIRCQYLLNNNKNKSYRSSKNTCSLLSGLLICKKCGSYMRPKLGRINKEGKQCFYYICELKEKTHGKRCNIPNINGLILDKSVEDELQKIHSNPSALISKIDKAYLQMNPSKDICTLQKKIKKEIEVNQKAIEHLINKLSLIDDVELTQTILDKISNIKSKIKSEKEKLLDLEQSFSSPLENNAKLIYLAQQLAYFGLTLNAFDTVSKRTFLSTFIEKLEWDGKNITIHLLGPKSSTRMTKMFPESKDSK